MRLALIIVVLAGLGSALSVAPTPVAAMSCAGPSLDVAQGQLLLSGARITGETFYDRGCLDAIECQEQPGCGRPDCAYDAPPAVPAEDVTLSLVQAGRTWRLGVVDADAEWRVAWTTTLPDDVRPGRARLVTDQPPVSVRVRVR